jgi:polyhydroxybutyrate depolymerase
VVAAALVAGSVATGSAGLRGSAAAVTNGAARAARAPSEGCGASNVTGGEERVTTSSGGVPRAYFRTVPREHDGERPVPLVVDLHGTTEPAAVHMSNSGLARFGAERGFATVTPEGSGPPPQWDTRAGSADMQFLVDLLDEVEEELCVDERRVFLTGYSNGAFFASAAACVLADRIAAVGLVAGIRDVPGCAPTRSVPAVAFHGTADTFVRYEGGLGSGVTSLPPAEAQELVEISAPTDSGVSVPEATAGWARRNGCADEPRRRSVADDVTEIRFRCPDRADVALYEIDGGGHTWPGSRFSKAIEQFVGPTTFSIDADEIMWRFFRAHPRPGEVTKG